MAGKSGEVAVSDGRTPSRWRKVHAWSRSLSGRLLLLGLTPLLVALPIMTAALGLASQWIIETQLRATLRVNVTGAEHYLAQLRDNARDGVSDYARAPRLLELLDRHAPAAELGKVLETGARDRGLSFLAVADPDGTIIASSLDLPPGARLWGTHVLRQAGIGMSGAAFESVEGAALAQVSPRLAVQARLDELSSVQGAGVPRALMISAAAHFPLSAHRPDAILVGGLLLNGDTALVERIREIIFPVADKADQDSMVAVHAGGVVVARSRRSGQAQSPVGAAQPESLTVPVLGQGTTWLGPIERDGISYTAAFSPIEDGEGRRIGMLGVGLPDRSIRDQGVFVTIAIAGTLALMMVAVSVVFMRAGNGLARRIVALDATTSSVRAGVRDARARLESRDDELGHLAANFDHLLDEIERRDDALRASNEELRRHRDRLDELVLERTQQLAAARDAAEGANRAKTALLANVSHELRTPLNHISGFAQLLAADLPDPEKKSYAETIVASSGELLTMVGSLLDTARLESNALELARTAFDLRPVIDRLIAGHRKQAQDKGLTLDVDLDSGLPSRLVGDPIRLEEVLHRLLENAVKFSDAGRVVLRVRCMSTRAGLADLRFEIEDEGIGITPEQRGRLFEPFEQGDASSTRRHGGAGLGLALCRRLVALMAGEIGVESGPGKGSVFWFTVTLPLAAPLSDPVPGVAADTPAARAAADRMMRLLRDDDLSAREEWQASRPLLGGLLGASASAFEQALDSFHLDEALAILVACRADASL